MSEPEEMTQLERLKSLLDSLAVKVYSTQVETSDILVVFGRVTPLVPSDKTTKLSESRLLRWIESALKACNDDDSWDLRLSRPWVLKKDKLVYTWDFTVKGNLDAALSKLEEIHVPKPPERAQVDVPTQQTKFKRGTVKPVRIGSIR